MSNEFENNQAILKASEEYHVNSHTRKPYGYNYSSTPGYHNSDTKRDVWSVAGYPDKLSFDNYYKMSSRFGIAHAGIHKIVNKCWQINPVITDGDPIKNKDRDLTEFEKDVKVLIDKFDLLTRLKGVDWRQRVGRYGGLIPILKETGKPSPDEPLTKVGGLNALVKIVPVFEAQIDSISVPVINEITNINYGMPEYYIFDEGATGDRNQANNNTYNIHPSRVYIVAEGADDGSIYGIPANESGYNSLLDLEKTCVSGAEGLFKNAKQRMIININDKAVASKFVNDVDKKQKFDDSVTDFSTGFDSNLNLYGMDAKSLQSTIADPNDAFTISLNAYAASINIPTAILIGQLVGVRASGEDSDVFSQYANSRCVNELTPMIKGFLNYLALHGVIAAPTNEIIVTWADYLEPSPTDKINAGKIMADTNKTLFDSGSGEPAYTIDEIRKSSGFDEKKKKEEFETELDDLDRADE